MSYVHEETVRVRHYECDPQGILHLPVLLHYMQEAAFGASTAVGFSPARYEQLKLQWLAYETELRTLAPIRYGDRLTLRTWVRDFRRVRSLRHYAVYRGDTLVAEADTDWVLLDLEKLFPTRITEDVVAAYAQGHSVPTTAQGAPFAPFPKDPSSDAYTHTRRVEPRDLDPAGHVNNAVYLQYIDTAQAAHLESLGWDAARLAAESGSAALVTHGVHIAYKQAARPGDALHVQTWLAAESTLRLTQITREADGKVIAQARTRWRLRGADGRSQPLPVALAAAIRFGG